MPCYGTVSSNPDRHSSVRPTVAIVSRGDAAVRRDASAENSRFVRVFEALAAAGIDAQPVIYDETFADAVRDQLLAVDGVLVWVDPIHQGKTRAALDPLLREIATRGPWVSAHPDVILQMGVKEVLYRTRTLGWGTDTDLYLSAQDFDARFPARLAAGGPRVLKQNRGNGGQGVWKVELVGRAVANLSPDTPVRVLHALRGSVPEELALGDFMNRCHAYFERGGRILDRAFQPRLPEGMIRCYMSHNEVVGFGQQLIKALIPPDPSASPEANQPGPRIMYPAEAPPFRQLREQMELEWVPGMQAILGIPTASLPALWDADFLYGPRTAEGADTYVLCEINVSSVAPYPDSAVPKVAGAVLARVRAARGGALVVSCFTA
jgi:hypothetical protein